MAVMLYKVAQSGPQAVGWPFKLSGYLADVGWAVSGQGLGVQVCPQRYYTAGELRVQGSRQLHLRWFGDSAVALC